MIFFHGIFLPWMRRFGAWLFWPALAVVAWGELTPHPPELAGPLSWDKLDHFIAYGGLSLRHSLVWVFLAVVSLGGLLEILQTLVGRDGEWGDFIANDLGALTGLAVAALYLAVPRRLVDGTRRD
jgi:VanZ family protein